jgi:threonine/homoserine/homoserine lactone efflux protein
LTKYFFLGILSALPFTISFGPVFFAITETSLKRGFLSGMVVSIGILLSDILYVTLIGLGFAAFFNDEYSHFLFSLLGGTMLLALGISFLIKKIQNQTSSDIVVSKRPIQSFVKGFVINSLNPYVALFWTGVIALVNTEMGISGGDFRSYFAGFLLILFMSDLLKAWLAKTLRRKLTEKLKIIYKVIGFIFLVFGVKLISESVIYFLK